MYGSAHRSPIAVMKMQFPQLLVLSWCLCFAGLQGHSVREAASRAAGSGGEQDQEFERRRARMVETQIRNRDITDPAVLRAMGAVPRHKLVPRDQVSEAYADRPLPIGYGQTISQPYIVALMTELVQPKKHHRAFELGTGSGYQAAVLAEIVDSVFTVEIVEPLAERAREALHGLGYGNIRVRWADGYFGWPEHAPFDIIVVTAAAEHIPPPLIEQLKDGGRMVIPVGHPFFVQNLVLVEKRDGKVSTRNITPVRFVPLTRQR